MRLATLLVLAMGVLATSSSAQDTYTYEGSGGAPCGNGTDYLCPGEVIPPGYVVDSDGLLLPNEELVQIGVLTCGDHVCTHADKPGRRRERVKETKPPPPIEWCYRDAECGE